jgi:MFS family permease
VALVVVRRILLASVLWGIGGGLSFAYLNFHFEAVGLSRAQIGYANAIPAVAAVLFSLPLAFLIPRLGYLRSLQLGGALSVLGLLGVALGWAIYPGMLVAGMGGALVQGSVAPLLARQVAVQNRVSIFTWQQALGSASGFVGGVLAGYLPGFMDSGLVVAVVALCYLLSTLSVLGLPEAHGQVGSFAFRNRRNWLLLMAPQFLLSLGAGLVIPFLNLYLRAKFDLDYSTVGWMFAVTSLTGIATVSIQPYLARRLGKVAAIVTVQAASLPFLAALAWSPWLPLVSVALFVRGALMNAAGPVYTALMMDHLEEEERPGFLLIESAVWQLGWAVSSAISGQVQQALGLVAFQGLFVAMMILYMASIAFYPLFFRPRPSRRRVLR